MRGLMAATRGAPPPERDDFVDVSHLGEGSVGVVTLVRHRVSGKSYALKAVEKKRVLEHELGAQLLEEVKTQMRVQHPNLLRCFDYFEDCSRVYLVLEYASGGDLYRHLRQNGPLSDPDAAHVFVQVACGVRYLHEEVGCIHRDLKPENIMLGEDLEVKVADFGWCAQADGRTTFCGTLCMLAPEMVTGRPYDRSVDVWALGVLLFEMLAGFSPFDQGGGLMDTCNNIVKRGITEELLLKLPEGARRLVSGLLTKEAARRLPLQEAVAQPWVLEQCAQRHDWKRLYQPDTAARGASAAAAGALLHDLPPTASLVVQPLPQDGIKHFSSVVAAPVLPAQAASGAGTAAEPATSSYSSAEPRAFFIGTSRELASASALGAPQPLASRGCIMTCVLAEAPPADRGAGAAAAAASAPPATSMPARPPCTYERLYFAATEHEELGGAPPPTTLLVPREVRGSVSGLQARPKARSTRPEPVQEERGIAAELWEPPRSAAAVVGGGPFAGDPFGAPAPGPLGAWLDDAMRWVGLGPDNGPLARGYAGGAPPRGAAAVGGGGAPLSGAQLALAEQVAALGFQLRDAEEAARRTSSVEAAVEWVLQHQRA